MAEKVQLEVEVKGGESVAQASEKVKSLKTQLKEMKEQLASGKLSGLEFQKLAQKAGQLQDRIGDVNNQVKALASDTRKLDGFVDVAQGIAGGFAAAQGALALFGSENEDVEKALLKVQGAVALLNGVQGIANVLQKESAAMSLLQATRLKVLNFIEAQRAASLQYTTVAMQKTAFAARMLGAALGTLGIGLLVAGLVMLIPKIIEWTSATQKQREEQERLNGEIGATNAWLEIELEQNDFFTQRSIKNAKLRGATEKEILELENKGREKNIQSLKKALAENEKLTREWNVNNFDTAENAEKALSELQAQYGDISKKLQQEQDKDELADLDAKLKLKQGKEKKSSEKVIKDKKDTFKELMDELENEQQVQQDFEDRAKEQQAERDRLSFELTASARQKEIKAQEDIMNERMSKAAGDAELMALIQEDYRKQVAEINRKYDEQDLQAKKEYNDQIIAAEKQLQDAKRGALDAGFNIAQDFAGKNKQLANALFAIQKGVAIAQVIVDTQKEIAGYYSNPTWSLLPDGGATIKTSFATAAKIRAATSIATIGATAIGKYITPSSGGNSGGGNPNIGGQPNIQGYTTNNQNSQQTGQGGNIRVFVTETDIRRTSNKVGDIYSQATVE